MADGCLSLDKVGYAYWVVVGCKLIHLEILFSRIRNCLRPTANSLLTGRARDGLPVRVAVSKRVYHKPTGSGG